MESRRIRVTESVRQLLHDGLPKRHWWPHRAELMVTCLATRPHWLLASLFRFQGAAVRHRSRPQRGSRWKRPQAPNRHSPLASVGAHPEPRGGPARGVRVNAPAQEHRGGPGIVWAGSRICKPAGRIPGGSRLASLADGIERHEAQGPQAPRTPRSGPSRNATTPCTRTSVRCMANLGIRGKGAMFWIGVVVARGASVACRTCSAALWL